MKIINQDILKITRGIIVHQVNCQGKMGAGLAKSISDLYPQVEKAYYDKFIHRKWQLGEVQFVKVSETPLYICNLAGQDKYGRDKNTVYTNYKYLRIGFKKVLKFSIDRDLQVYLPYKIGCGLANGDWNKVTLIIEEIIPESIICTKEE